MKCKAELSAIETAISGLFDNEELYLKTAKRQRKHLQEFLKYVKKDTVSIDKNSKRCENVYLIQFILYSGFTELIINITNNNGKISVRHNLN